MDAVTLAPGGQLPRHPCLRNTVLEMGHEPTSGSPPQEGLRLAAKLSSVKITKLQKLSISVGVH